MMISSLLLLFIFVWLYLAQIIQCRKFRDSVPEEGKSHKSSNQEKVMAEIEAVIVSEVEKLKSLMVDKANINRKTKKAAKDIIKEVKKIVKKVRDMKWEEKRKLKYLISDVVQDVSYVHHQIKVGKDLDLGIIYMISREIKKINKAFHQLLQNDGDGEGDGDGDVVGLEEVVKSLLHKMISITCIVGYDGFGKTTLARQLYNHADVVKKFKFRAWVNCFNIVGRRELLINIIQQVASQPKDLDKMDGQGLQNMLRDQLIGNPYFIVLDNIWRDSCLKLVRKSLPPEDKQSILLLTYTEDRNFVFYPDNKYTYEIRPLDEGKSWKLLMKTMFPGGNNNCADEFPKRLERIGKRMLMKHSGGVPLAIKDVGMEWAQKRKCGSEWEEIVDSNDLELRASLRALESSFYPFLDPRDEKACFLHLGLFKLGTTIKPQKFIQTWHASRGEPQPISVIFEGDSLFEKVGINMNSHRTKNYEVGAIFHKLAIKKAKEGNYGATHRVIYCSRERANCPTDQDERLIIICLFFYGGGCFDASPSYWKCFQQLRVLDFEGFGLKSLPETVGELIALRYLGLRNNYLQQLPSSLGCLENLEVLDIALNFMVVVPDIIWEMETLIHLYMSDIFCRSPLKIVALENLQTLTYISVDNLTYEVSGLHMMNRTLRKLGIEELNENSNVSKLFALLFEMTNLECLVLRGSRFRSMPSLDKLGALKRVSNLKLYGRITMLLKAENFPPSLYELSLVNSYFDEDPMPVLEKLSELVYLKLQNAYTGRQMVISEGGFPQLRKLCIRELWNLRNIQVGPGALPKCWILEITSCPCLQSLPEELTANIEMMEMVTTKNISAKIKKLNIFSEIRDVVVDYQP